MNDGDAYRLIGKRAEALAKKPEVQKKMLEIASTEGKEAAETYLYRLAIATLCGK